MAGIHSNQVYWPKIRSLRLVLTRLVQARNIQDTLIKTRWYPLFHKGREIGYKFNGTSYFWGYSKDGIPKLFSLNEGISFDCLNEETMVRVIPRSDLILYSHDLNEKIRGVAQKRLRCEAPDPIRCDELVQEYFYVEERLAHIYRVTSRYDGLLHRGLYDLFGEGIRYKSKDGRKEYQHVPTMVTLRMDDQAFRFVWNGRKFEEVENSIERSVDDEVIPPPPVWIPVNEKEISFEMAP